MTPGQKLVQMFSATISKSFEAHVAPRAAAAPQLAEACGNHKTAQQKRSKSSERVATLALATGPFFFSM